MALKAKGFTKCNNQSWLVTKAKVLNPNKSLATNKRWKFSNFSKQSFKRLQ